MAAADLLCKFDGLFGRLAGLHCRQAQAMAHAQRRQRQDRHQAGLRHKEDVNGLGIIAVMIMQPVQQNRAENGRAKPQRGLLQRA